MGQFIAPKATTTQRLTIIPDQGELLFDTTVNKLYGGDGTTTGGFLIGNGDVSGPSSAVNNRVVFFDGPTGKLIKDSGLTLSGTNTGDQTITLTGDVTGSGTGSFAASISAGSVTLAKMANLSANSIIGNNTGSAATPIALSGTNVTAMLDAFSSTLKGLAPASGGGTTNFLRADGTWAAPPNSGGTVTSVSALTLGTSGTDLSSSVANGTTTPVITLNVPDASSIARGALTSTDWSTFNNKQNAITTGTTSQYFRGDLSLATFPILGTWSTLDYPTWTTGTPFVKMTAAGTFSLDTATYLTTNTLLTGLSGGQTVIGGTAVSDNLTLLSNNTGTKGKIILGTLSAYDETNDRLGIGTTSPSYGLHIVKSSGTSLFISSTASGSTAFQANGTTTVTSGTTPHVLIQLISSPTANSTAGSRSLYMRHSLNAVGINFTNSGTNGPTSSFFENRILNVGTITSVTGAIFNGVIMGSDALTCGTITDTVGIRAFGVSSFSNTLTNTITNSKGIYIHTAGKTASQTITNQVGLNVEALSSATNNTAILLGTTTIPSGNFAIYSAGTETSYFAGSIQLVDKDFILSIGTGTKIGTATGQKLSFWNKTPIIQPTTGLSVTLTFTANSGTAVNDASTFGGYTLKQIAQALINIGILA